MGIPLLQSYRDGLDDEIHKLEQLLETPCASEEERSTWREKLEALRVARSSVPA